MIRVDLETLRRQLEMQPTSELEAMLHRPDTWQPEARALALTIVEGRRRGAFPEPRPEKGPLAAPIRPGPGMTAVLVLIGFGLAALALVLVSSASGIGPCGAGTDLGDITLGAGAISILAGVALAILLALWGVIVRLIAPRP